MHVARGDPKGDALVGDDHITINIPATQPNCNAAALARVRRAEMVKAFIEPGEYRRRFFGPPTDNQEAQVDGTHTGL